MASNRFGKNTSYEAPLACWLEGGRRVFVMRFLSIIFIFVIFSCEALAIDSKPSVFDVMASKLEPFTYYERMYIIKIA